METKVEQAQDFFKVLRDRHSVRHYDPTVTISQADLQDMLKEATLAPSSANLQPWRFLVITDQALKEKLLPIANHQQQVVDASAVIAILGDLEGYKQAERIYEQAVASGYMDEELKQSFITRITNGYASMSAEKIKNIVLIDGGLIAMQLMLIAKAKGYDTVPMGGFHPEQFKEAFGISERYIPVMLLPVGKASEPAHSSPRLAVNDVTFWNKMTEGE
ncbi:nitroreductase family protein [Paenibacillus apiarius]|uniref:nitroreductase family protein n=1 Tax=Paenibacillus apiarius TaxID=46240 RepID=UPI001981133E|nr:nitroreductase family protein [Paenibacillus apiarius]MBN3524197.1 nitroreductase family protein [Paenibacillus apiarius]